MRRCAVPFLANKLLATIACQNLAAVNEVYLFPWARMHVLMGLPIAAGMSLGFKPARHEVHLAVFHAALGKNARGKLAYRGCLAAQDSNLKAIVVIEMHMHRRDVGVVKIVMGIGKPLR